MSATSSSGAQMLEALRRYVGSYQTSVVQFARWMDLPVTDANALGEIMWAEAAGRTLSPTALARRIALTTGATSALLNRLEAAGLVTRSREHRDRRAVALRATPAAHDRARPFQAEAAARLDAALAELDEKRLQTVTDVVERFAAILPRSDEDA